MSDEPEDQQPSPQTIIQITPPTVDAVVRDGVIVPVTPLDLPDGTPIRAYLTLRLEDTSAPAPTTSSDKTAHIWARPRSSHPQNIWARLNTSAWRAALAQPLGQQGIMALLNRSDLALLSLGMLVYALVRFIGLTAFPIYFFCDEAIHTNQALELIRNGLLDERGVFLPPYFRNVEKFNLSLSVYLQGITALLFGKSVFVNRATSASVTLLAGIAVALMLKLIYKQRLWWAGPLALAAIPVWFLHSRTSFETVLMVSFYACFLCTYLLYRYSNPQWIIAAIIFGAATFYSYANGQGVMFASSLLLLFSDLGYHWRTVRTNLRLLGAALLTTAVVTFQYIRFRLLYPDAIEEHLRVMNSIWMTKAPFADKMADFTKNYLEGMSINYWFVPNNEVDLERHTFKDWGNIPMIFLPFILIGLWICIRQWRSSAHRLIFIAIIAAPFSASLAYIHNYRVLSMVIPAALLFCLGIEQVWTWLQRIRIPGRPLAFACAIWLVVQNGIMLQTALAGGPLWYRDYGLYGMQYGSQQVFSTLAAQLEEHPTERAFMTHSWANNPNAFAPFFLTDEQAGRVQFLVIDEFLGNKRDIPENTFFVMTTKEYNNAIASGKFVLDTPFRIIMYPDGTPGFYFVNLRYVDNIDAIIAVEREARRKLIESSITLDGQEVIVRHSTTDLGSLADLIDDNPKTLLRGLEANPFVIEYEFPEPREVHGITLEIWRLQLELTVLVTPADGSDLQVFTQRYEDSPNNLKINYDLPNGPIRAKRIRIELYDMLAGDIAKIHIPTLKVR